MNHNRSVRLVGVTKPRLPEVETAEELVAYTARVSNPGNQANILTAPKLLKYLVTNHHWSPFEMVHVVMEINTTREIARQILRHRSFSFQEFSQRYADVNELPAADLREARLQDKKNRQNSVEVDDAELEEEWAKQQATVLMASRDAYAWATGNGIAKEQARVVLPEGLTTSRLYMSGTLRSWVHFCQLRGGNGTQKEHRILAQEALEILLEEFPSLEEVLAHEPV